MGPYLALLLSIVVPLTGCASYAPTSAPIPKGSDMAVWATEGDLEVGVDPYVQKDRQKAVFDADLSGEGVLPIQIYVKNRGDRALLVRRSDMALVFPDGGEIRPAGATAVSAKMESIGGVVGATLAFGLIGFLVSSSAKDKAQAARLADYQSKEFQDSTLLKDDAAHGFVYFIPPPGTQTFNEATLRLRVVDTKEATSVVVSLPLSGFGFKGVPAKVVEKQEASAEASSPPESPRKEDDPTTAPSRMDY